jgi:nucleoside-diphosphate-sugar epimerase
MSTVGITGATGFVGSAISRAFKKQGWEVIELGRRPSSPNVDFIPFDLAGTTLPLLNRRLDVFIHCAHQFGTLSMQDEERVNVNPSIRLLQISSRRFVFISSMASFREAKSIYGRGKFAIEQKVLAAGGIVIRPGLVTGEGSRGLVPSLSKIVRISPLVPLLNWGQQPLYLCDVNRLAFNIVNICESKENTFSKPIVIANSVPVTLQELMKLLTTKYRRRVIFLPLPAKMIELGLKFLEKIGLRLPFRSDSIVGLLNTNPHPWLNNQKMSTDDVP